MSKAENLWRPERLRLTVFLLAPLQAEDVPSLGDVFSVEVEAKEIRGKRVSESASYGVGKLSLVVQPERVDWVWLSVPDQDGLGNLGETSEAYGAFFPRLESWVASLEKLNRVAIGAILGMEADDKEDGYRKIQPFIPELQIDPATTSELSYQINHHQTVEIGGKPTTLNRLKKWNVRRIQMAQVDASSGALVESVVGRPIISPSCEHDFSSLAGESIEMSGKDAVTIFTALQQESLAALKAREE